MNWIYYPTMILFVTVCVFLLLLILIQKGRGGGLASAFGGAGGNTAFGSKTGDVLTWATSIVFGIFVLLAVALNLMASHQDKVAKQQLLGVSTDVPVAPADGGTTSLPAAPTTAPGK